MGNQFGWECIIKVAQGVGAMGGRCGRVSGVVHGWLEGRTDPFQVDKAAIVPSSDGSTRALPHGANGAACAKPPATDQAPILTEPAVRQGVQKFFEKIQKKS